MRWQGGRRGGNIEDRRGVSAAGVGGIGLGGVVLALIGYFVFGIDPSTTMSVVGGAGGQQTKGQLDQKASISSAVDLWKEIKETLGTIVGPSGRFEISPTTGTLTVTATPARSAAWVASAASLRSGSTATTSVTVEG